MTTKCFPRLAFMLAGAVLAPHLTQAEESADSALSFYVSNLSDKEAGVYESDECLYVQISVPLPSDRRKRSRIRGDVLKSGTELLKNWAVSRSGGKAGKVENLKGNAEKLAKLFDEYLPGWGLPEWDFKSCLREVPHTEKNGFYRTAWIFDKKDLMNRLPAAYRQAIEMEAFLKMAPRLVTKIFEGQRREEFIRMVLDSSALKDLDEDIAHYLEKSERASNFRSVLERARNPTPVESWTERPGEPTQTSLREVIVVTNRIEKGLVTTNRVERFQNAHEIAEDGRRYKNKTTETDIACDVEVIETKTIQTVTEISRVIRQHHSVSKKGYARFEELFLSGGEALNFATPSTDLGKAALAMNTDAKLIEALQENPGDRDAWLALGNKWAETGDDAGAWICARAVEKIAPEGEDLHTLQMSLSGKMELNTLEFGYAILALGNGDVGVAREIALKVLAR